MIQAAVLFIIDGNVDLSKSLRQLFYNLIIKCLYKYNAEKNPDRNKVMKSQTRSIQT